MGATTTAQVGGGCVKGLCGKGQLDDRRRNRRSKEKERKRGKKKRSKRVEKGKKSKHGPIPSREGGERGQQTKLKTNKKNQLFDMDDRTPRSLFRLAPRPNV